MARRLRRVRRALVLGAAASAALAALATGATADSTAPADSAGRFVLTGRGRRAADLQTRSTGASWPKTISLMSKAAPSTMGLCLDLVGGKAAEGTGLQVWECNGQQSQVWIFDAGSNNIRYGLAPNLCLDIGEQPRIGDQFRLWECNGTPQQTLGYDSNTKAIQLFLYEPLGCLELPFTQGGPAVINLCDNTRQQFQQLNIYYGSTMRVGSDYKMCLDLAGGTTSEGAAVKVSPCRNVPSQFWILNEVGMVISGGNYGSPAYCLDMHDMKQGNQVIIWGCNGFAQQKWAYDSSKMTLSARFGQGVCLDLTGGADEDGTPVAIYNCNECWNQQWVLSTTKLTMDGLLRGVASNVTDADITASDLSPPRPHRPASAPAWVHRSAPASAPATAPATAPALAGCPAKPGLQARPSLQARPAAGDRPGDGTTFV